MENPKLLIVTLTGTHRLATEVKAGRFRITNKCCRSKTHDRGFRLRKSRGNWECCGKDIERRRLREAYQSVA